MKWHDVAAEQLERAPQDDGRRDAVDVVVAVNRDPLAARHGGLEALDRLAACRPAGTGRADDRATAPGSGVAARPAEQASRARASARAAIGAVHAASRRSQRDDRPSPTRATADHVSGATAALPDGGESCAALRLRRRTPGRGGPSCGTSRSAGRAARPTASAADVGERARQRPIEQRRRGRRVGVGAAHRLGHDLVDDAARQQVRRGDLQRLGGFDLLAGVAPQDRRAAFGRNDAVDRELVHQDAVADRDAERAAAAALAADVDDDRHVEHRHLAQVERDGLGDAALLGLDARIGRRRVDEHDDRAGRTSAPSPSRAAPCDSPRACA